MSSGRTNASLTYPTGVALDAAGNLAVADIFNERIRKVYLATLVEVWLHGPTDPVPVGSEVSLGAPLGDTSADRAVWDWGDGTTTEVLDLDGVLETPHTYIAPGVYTVGLSPLEGQEQVGGGEYQFVVVYDPDGGFVTGHGWIDSPPGAFAPNPSLTGKAHFGFVSRYAKGKTTPDGQTQFQFKAGDLLFRSTSYDWLVVAGSKCQFKGVGEIDGVGNYGFMLSAIDGKNGDPDKFRIKIWDKGSGGIVYDNQLGAEDDAEPSTAIGGGNITVHKGS